MYRDQDYLRAFIGYFRSTAQSRIAAAGLPGEAERVAKLKQNFTLAATDAINELNTEQHDAALAFLRLFSQNNLARQSLVSAVSAKRRQLQEVFMTNPSQGELAGWLLSLEDNVHLSELTTAPFLLRRHGCGPTTSLGPTL